MSDVDELLERAEGFVRAGDYLEAQMCVRQLRDDLGDVAEAAPARARVARTLRRYDALVGAWQAQNSARSAAYVARERRAIGAATQEPTGGVTAWSRAFTWLGRVLRPARRARPPARRRLRQRKGLE